MALWVRPRPETCLLPGIRSSVTTGTKATLAKFAEDGGRSVGSIADAANGADIVITMVPDSPQVEEVVFGEEGLLDTAPDGLLFIDMSSIRPDVAIKVAEACRAKGMRPLDAPVSGGEKGAVDGTLSIMVGGEASDFDEALPVLRSVGKTIVHLGPSGSGQTVSRRLTSSSWVARSSWSPRQ